MREFLMFLFECMEIFMLKFIILGKEVFKERFGDLEV
jgi:hypothetical protein